MYELCIAICVVWPFVTWRTNCVMMMTATVPSYHSIYSINNVMLFLTFWRACVRTQRSASSIRMEADDTYSQKLAKTEIFPVLFLCYFTRFQFRNTYTTLPEC